MGFDTRPHWYVKNEKHRFNAIREIVALWTAWILVSGSWKWIWPPKVTPELIYHAPILSDRSYYCVQLPTARDLIVFGPCAVSNNQSRYVSSQTYCFVEISSIACGAWLMQQTQQYYKDVAHFRSIVYHVCCNESVLWVGFVLATRFWWYSCSRPAVCSHKLCRYFSIYLILCFNMISSAALCIWNLSSTGQTPVLNVRAVWWLTFCTELVQTRRLYNINLTLSNTSRRHFWISSRNSVSLKMLVAN